SRASSTRPFQRYTDCTGDSIRFAQAARRCVTIFRAIRLASAREPQVTSTTTYFPALVFGISDRNAPLNFLLPLAAVFWSASPSHDTIRRDRIQWQALPSSLAPPAGAESLPTNLLFPMCAWPLRPLPNMF